MMRKPDHSLVSRTGLRQSRRWAVALAFGAGSLAAGSAQAVQFDLGKDAGLSWTTTLGYSAAYRVDDQDERILAMPNADDGDRAFSTGLIQSEISALTELELTYKNFGAFIRADAFFNQPYNHNSDNMSDVTDNTPSNSSFEFVDETKDHHRDDTRLLDAFVYGNFDIGGTRLNLRVGRQVVSWGESLFLSGISAVQSPVDVTESHEPAVEVKKLLLPQETVLGQWQLTNNLSLSSYYQWNWEPSRLDGSGSYFATTDLLQGGEVFLANVPQAGIVPALQRAPDERPDGGQYGVNMHYTVPALGYTDFGVYYLSYHSKAPQIVFNQAARTYRAKYFEDIDLYGLSMNTTLFRYIQLGSEISYKEGRPVLAQDGNPVRAKTAQALLSTITNLPYDFLWTGTTTLSFEVGYNRITDRDEDELLQEKGAARYAASLALSYPNIAPLLDMTITPSVGHGFHNDSSARTVQYNSGNLQLGIGASFDYGADWSFNINYVDFRGEPSENLLTDRDFVSADVNYSF